MSMLRFDGRVALVTGAGGGLGREYARLLASRGASVVVNDLGGDAKGGGRSSRAADETVEMIRSRGGKAVANYDSVEEGDKVVKTAIDAFGRIDIVINNAGILRDRSFPRISDEDWDLIHRVHLRGSFLVTRAAFPYMKKQNYGRIIMTSSPSGIYGNFGQANYSAAKLGLVGLSNTIAVEGRKYNVHCNTIAPTAYSRLTKDLFPPEAEELLKAEHVAPVVAYLCHESCEDNGGLFETAGGWVAMVRWQKAEGGLARVKGKEFTPEDVRDSWSQVCDMTKPVYHKAMAEVTASLMEASQQIESGSNAPSPMEEATKSGLLSVKGNKEDFPPFPLTHRDIILYALGVGASISRSDKRDLKFLYEMHPEFSALPTFAVIPPQKCMQSMFAEGKLGDFHPANLLHGEQFLEMYKPFPTSGSVTCHSEVVEVLDKGKGAVLVINVTLKDEKLEPVCMNQYVTFIVGAGGFGGKKNSPVVKPLAQRPTDPPDASVTNQTGESQAALYRLSGDYNPLHIDPDFAAVGGFSEPILHGLASFGIAARNVLRHFAGDDVAKFKAIKTRFARPVLPGQTIQTDMWRRGNRIHFECKVVENGQAVLTGAYVDLTDVVGAPPSTGPAPQPAATPQRSGSGGGVQSDVLFEEMATQVVSSPEMVQKVKAIYLWNITDSEGKTASQWTVDLKTPPGAVYRGPPKDGVKPGCTLTISDEDFVSIASGKLSAQKAFFSKKLKISGNIMLSQKLEVLFKKRAKL